MQIAKSMYLGGMLFEAKDANYSDCKDYGLVCVECQQAVFLRKGTERHYKGGKVSTVKPHFSHYHLEDLENPCESRIISKAGRKKLKQLAVASKNQRLDLYNKHLWDIIKRSYLSNQDRSMDDVKYYLRILKIQRDLKPKINYLQEALRLNMASVMFHVSRQVDFVYYSQMERQDFLDILSIKEFSYFNNRSTIKIQTKILKEIVAYLSTKTSKFVLGKLIAMSYAEVVCEHERLTESEDNPTTIIKKIISILSVVCWGYEMKTLMEKKNGFKKV